MHLKNKEESALKDKVLLYFNYRKVIELNTFII
ncbi:hypothetical protein BCM20_001827 [Clostridium beijerinckii]|nr:hypothetical protein [Clostridium beijerinckii]NYC01872.1 hypothetical protein [Clostridium beijerinckii]